MQNRISGTILGIIVSGLMRSENLMIAYFISTVTVILHACV